MLKTSEKPEITSPLRVQKENLLLVCALWRGKKDYRDLWDWAEKHAPDFRVPGKPRGWNVRIVSSRVRRYDQDRSLKIGNTIYVMRTKKVPSIAMRRKFKAAEWGSHAVAMGLQNTDTGEITVLGGWGPSYDGKRVKWISLSPQSEPYLKALKIKDPVKEFVRKRGPGRAEKWEPKCALQLAFGFCLPCQFQACFITENTPSVREFLNNKMPEKFDVSFLPLSSSPGLLTHIHTAMNKATKVCNSRARAQRLVATSIENSETLLTLYHTSYYALTGIPYHG